MHWMLRDLILISYLLKLTSQWLKAWRCWSTSHGIKNCSAYLSSVCLSCTFFTFNFPNCVIVWSLLIHFCHLVMSAQDEVSVVVKCLRLGAADYLVKPLRTNELLNLWTHMWRRRRMVCFAWNSLFCYFKLFLFLAFFSSFFALGFFHCFPFFI